MSLFLFSALSVFSKRLFFFPSFNNACISITDSYTFQIIFNNVFNKSLSYCILLWEGDGGATELQCSSCSCYAVSRSLQSEMWWGAEFFSLHPNRPILATGYCSLPGKNSSLVLFNNPKKEKKRKKKVILNEEQFSNPVCHPTSNSCTGAILSCLEDNSGPYSTRAHLDIFLGLFLN